PADEPFPSIKGQSSACQGADDRVQPRQSERLFSRRTAAALARLRGSAGGGAETRGATSANRPRLIAMPRGGRPWGSAPWPERLVGGQGWKVWRRARNGS